MKIQYFALIISLIFSFTLFGQQDEPLIKVDSLLEIRQPNAAQKELWSVIEKAKSENDHQTLLKAYPYFYKMLSPLEMEERASLYFKVLKSTQTLPEPSNAIAQLQLTEQIVYNKYQWLGGSYLKIYDSLNLGEDTVRYNFVLDQMKSIEKQLTTLRSYDFKPYQEVLLKENDSLFILQSVADYAIYKLINFYESPLIQNNGTLKNANIDHKDWYGLSTDFSALNFKEQNITTKILSLFQSLEENNKNIPNYLSTSVHQRLHYLKRTFGNDSLVEKAWEEQFVYFKSTSARSKFLFEIARNKYKKGKDYHFELKPEVEHLIKEAHDELEAELKKYPNNDFKHEITSLISIIENKELSISSPNIYAPNRKIPFLINHRNYSSQVLRLYRVKNYDPKKNTNLKEYALSENLVLERTLNLALKNDKLFQKRSSEQLLDGIIKPGKYFIVATNDDESLTELAKDREKWNDKNIHSNTLTISQVSISTTSFENEFTILAVDGISGLPIENAVVQLYYYDVRVSDDFIEFANGETDEEGLFKIDTKGYHRVLYTVSHEHSLIKGTSYVRDAWKEEEAKKVELFTDRSIYRPGQTVYFKGIVFKGKNNDFEVVANQKVELVLKDAAYQEVYQSTFTTNKFGSIDGSFQLPSGSGLGRYNLQVQGTNGLTNSGTNFSVEEYKRPSFEVELNQPKEEARLNDTVSVSGSAKAYAGFPITNANVEYTVYRKWNRYWRYFSSPFGSDLGDLLSEGSLKTDENGAFTIDFFAEKDPNAVQNAYYSYEVQAKITDLSGETHEETIALQLSEIGVSIQFNAPMKMLTHDEEYAVIDVVNLSGEKQSDYSGKVEIYKEVSNPLFLDRIWNNAEVSQIEKDEFLALFPNMEWNVFEDHSNQKELIKTVSFNSGDSIKLNDWINNEQGDYIFEMYVETKNGDSIQTSAKLSVIDVESKEIPTHSALWSFVSSNEVKVGEAVDFQVGTSFKDVKALVSFYRKDELISREWVDLKNRYSKCYTVQEEDRGVLTYEVVLFHNGVFYKETKTIQVPFSNKELKIKTSTFRDLLEPGQKEHWSFTIQDENQEFVKAELAATLYDASLDQFRGHSWNLFPYYGRGSYSYWTNNWSRSIVNDGSGSFGWELRSILNQDNLRYNYVEIGNRYRIMDYNDREMSEVSIKRENDRLSMSKSNVLSYPDSGSGYGVDANSKNEEEEGFLVESTKSSKSSQPVAPRSNFNETAFFYPTIYANDTNEYVLNFTLPESLTKWKLLMLGHNKEMQIGTFQKEIIAQKELMVTANAPRFVRQGDAIDFSAKVVNLTKEEQRVEVFLNLENPLNGDRLNLIGRQPLSKMVTIAAGASEEVVWNMIIGDQDVIQYTITASNESFSDGEQNSIPVLSNRVLVTETKHVLLRDSGKSTHEFDAFKNQNSSTLDNKSFTIEYTDNLAWNAVMALPNLSKQNDQSITTLVNSYYANAIAMDVVAQNPRIQTIFNQWKSKTPDALLSELEKNEELKTILLEETPWVMEAKNETEQRRRIAQLFELNQLQDNQINFLVEILKKQNTDGGFSWFSGGKSNLYITQNILTRFGQLRRLEISIKKAMPIIEKAERFVANEQVRRYKKYIEGVEDYRLSSLDVYWLYSRTFFKNERSEAIDEVEGFFREKVKTQWTQFNPYLQGMIGMYFKSEGLSKEANLVLSSLKDRSKKNSNIGTYWVENSGYYWHQNKIGSQAMLISFFEVMDVSSELLEEMRLWLILNKESNSWGESVATADAIYAILSSNKNYLNATEKPTITAGGNQFVYSEVAQENEVSVEYVEGLGQVKNKWVGAEITSQLGSVEIERTSNAPGVLNMYWQYTDELSKIKSSQNESMQIEKTYRRIEAGKKGEQGIEDSTFVVGDKIEIELIVTVDRDLEFVHIKDLRPAGFEPIDAISGYKYNHKLSYYQSPKDVSMDYFVDNMPKGSYKFTYTVYATHSGNFNSSVAEIQCHYAPKFSGYSGTVGVRIGR
ncbi:alpha-2-macroglobulin family protein [Brumimicrobium aurantiacum]|uniref:Alpha-2-macroglobulin domain-containing protein n=1 Tax=Brumimicrobium aurantiacum TaxID=1737063 RepID=A0A3E1F0S3_9FLAO|nr:MG2 domain-containing protein [Brumimicrobium aurantiacum]RFC55410.1 hypothetical protein DXU93_00295 [Brumimicrobium aurantiacum]